MVQLFNRSWTRSELQSYAGDPLQIAVNKLAEWADGTGRGLRVADVRSGSGLRFSVLLERGMDISPAAYKGMPLAWVSRTGWGHPMYYEPQGAGWLRTFGGDLLTGCGMTYLGALHLGGSGIKPHPDSRPGREPRSGRKPVDSVVLY